MIPTIDDEVEERDVSSMAKSSRESPVFQLVRANHEEAEKGHHRLRVDLREHEERLIVVERMLSEHGASLAALKSATPELSKSTLSAGSTLKLFVAALAIVVGQLATTWGLRSDIRDITTQMNAQRMAQQANQQLQDERAARQDSKTDAIDKKQELLRIKFDELRDEVLGRARKPR